MKGKTLSRTVANISVADASLKRDQRRLFCFGEKMGFLDGFPEAVGLVFLEGVEFVQAFDEEQVGELLDDSERIGDAAGVERHPNGIDF